MILLIGVMLAMMMVGVPIAFAIGHDRHDVVDFQLAAGLRQRMAGYLFQSRLRGILLILTTEPEIAMHGRNLGDGCLPA